MPRVAEPRAAAYTPTVPEPDFAEVVGMIRQARAAAHRAVNTVLIDLYWRVGAYISQKVESAAWGEGVVAQLADHIAREHPELRGFTRRNLFRMRQFYEAYRGSAIVSPLVAQLPWTHHLIILGRARRPQEREFYLQLAIKEYRLQVGPRDFHLDLLFYHRGLQALVAFELKAAEFEPGHLGQLEFYLEALDRDVRKPHERPSIGVLLCATRTAEVVEYALARSASPAMVAEYAAHLPSKALLEAKLAEYAALLAPAGEGADDEGGAR